MNRSEYALGAVVTLVAGAAIGAGIYAAVRPGGTTTVIQDGSQQIAAQSGLTVSEVYQRTYRGVVDIVVGGPSSFEFGRGGQQGQGGEGSGFVYDDRGDIVTNNHVVAGESSIRVRFWNGSQYTAKLVGHDPSTDLAVVKVSAPASMLHPLTLGNSDAIEVGAGVVAIGSPFGYAESVTSGIVSALHREMTSPDGFTIDDAIQTDAAINHGNSGGPLLNAQAQVIGVNSQIQSSSGGSDGVGFAIPSNTIRSVASTLVAGKTVEHAYLGVRITDASTAGDVDAGALVTRVGADSPAARGGLAANDIVIGIAGTKITSSEDLSRAVDEHKPGETIEVTVLRKGQKHVLHVKLGTRPTTA